MQLRYKGACHSCRLPLDPYILVDSSFEFRQAITWSILTDVNGTWNDCVYKFLGPHKVVRMCQQCYFYKPKISLKELRERESCGSKLSLQIPPRKTWNSFEIYEWYKGIRTCPMTWNELPIEMKRYPYTGFIIKFTPL